MYLKTLFLTFDYLFTEQTLLPSQIYPYIIILAILEKKCFIFTDTT